MGRGTYKYICEDCQAENWLSRKDRGSRFKPRCTSCGSLWLTPSKGSKAHDKIAEVSDASREQARKRAEKMGKEI